MAMHCSILAWRIPWPGEPGGATVHGITKSQTGLNDFTHTHIHVHTQFNALYLFWDHHILTGTQFHVKHVIL